MQPLRGYMGRGVLTPTRMRVGLMKIMPLRGYILANPTRTRVG